MLITVLFTAEKSVETPKSNENSKSSNSEVTLFSSSYFIFEIDKLWFSLSLTGIASTGGVCCTELGELGDIRRSR